ncbi:hypothetical protein Cyast_2419 [Cyanobacterium stanieri PCC 7202]|uniref:Uncharacterized protein n=1 Tax=Cyanobacterium stanieri (strain ATCC 29140 / PCC 7202) TaxID=292563 RepID=K9YPP0_CYASC|nr:hypothetical protein Cyast_2419 [Cyanobacterium stanieri PCC 7202]
MKSLKINDFKTKFFLFVFGCGYLTFFSSMDITYPFLKPYIVLLPVQIILVVYFLFRKKGK